MKNIRQAATVVAISLLCCATASFAQKFEELSVEVTGNQRIDSNAIISFLALKDDQDIDETAISNALSNVYATGLFADVNVSKESGTLLVKVVENPIISEISFEGNNRISNEDLTNEITLAPRAVYTKPALKKDVKRILDLYHKNARFATQVVPKVIQLEQNRINVVFEIDEGEQSEISKISFVGNKAYDNDKLRRVVSTKESRWYRFFSSDDNYDPERLAFDQELLRRYYVSHGYADFRVLDASAELTPDKSSFIITFTIDEGQIYNFGKVDVDSRIPAVASESLTDQLITNSTETFNADLVDETKERVTKKLGNLGYAFVKVKAQYNRDVKNAVIDISYVIEEGPRVYLEKIIISGNLRTLDQVIRREFRIAEGDPYNASQIQRSKQRIDNLGFFKNVVFSEEKGSADDKVVIRVAVEEKSTGELSFGAGFSTTDGALGDVSITERNLLGKGQYMKLNFTLASVRQEVDLSFTEPRFLGRDMQAGFDLFKIKRTSDSSTSSRTYDDDVIGGQVRLTYPVTEFLNHTVRYSLRSDEITNVDSNASTFIKLQAGQNTTSLVGHSLVYDKRDNNFSPKEGYIVRFNQDLAGLGGDAKFIRHELRGAYYTPTVNRELILKLAARAGNIFSYGGEDVRINDRFFIGGNDIRGFQSDGIGPRDSVARDPLGGNTYISTTAELTFPLGLPEELGVSGSVFTDAGTLFETDDNEALGSPILDESSIRASFGVGVLWKSPLGPIRIDFAHPYLKESFDETEEIRFSFGTRF